MNRELVEAARRGDRDAFEALVRREVPGVYRTAVAILGSPADAEEATQDAFVSAWRSLATLRDPTKFDAWLGRIVINACRMALRRRRSVREIRLDDAPLPESPEPAIDAGTFDRAFDRLSVDDRLLLVRVYRDGRSLAETATHLAVPIGTVKSRLSRARAALQRAIDREDPQ